MSVSKIFRRLSAVAFALVVTSDPAAAWTADGHRLISSVALEILDLDGLEIDRAARSALIEASLQPDLMRPREFEQLRDREAPEHYLDLERLRGEELPSLRSDYLLLIARLPRHSAGDDDRTPLLETFGTVPYAVVESTQRLAVGFAQLRRRPDDPVIRSMAMYHAGLAAHYAQDLCQPLHTTIDFDGRARPDGSSPRTGLHRMVDGLLGRVPLRKETLGSRRSRALVRLFPSVIDHLEESHALVGRVYQLEPDFRASSEGARPSAGLRSLAEERFRVATALTADLIHTAWNLAAALDP